MNDMNYWENITNINDKYGVLRDDKYCDLLKNLDGQIFGKFLADEVGLPYKSTIEFLANTLKYVSDNASDFE